MALVPTGTVEAMTPAAAVRAVRRLAYDARPAAPRVVVEAHRIAADGSVFLLWEAELDPRRVRGRLVAHWYDAGRVVGDHAECVYDRRRDVRPHPVLIAWPCGTPDELRAIAADLWTVAL